MTVDARYDLLLTIPVCVEVYSSVEVSLPDILLHIKSNTFLSYRVVVMLSTVEMNVELHREVAPALEQWNIKAT